MTVRITAQGFDALTELWQHSPAIVQNELSSAMNEAVAYAQHQIVSRTPTGAGEGGHLAASINSEVMINPSVQIGYVGTSKLYAEAVELGTKPHMPPIEPLVNWVEAVLNLEGLEAEKVATLIALKIKSRGTEGQFMFKEGLEASEPYIQERFNQAMKTLLNTLGGGND
ncbi:hypothetical protein FQP85_08420 [Pseudoalteromonas neustonica]|uniref:HK97 gp10 family phage protein n=1 Tax=Pseudoalteromonas neustonica TaxID=1840331 RepID=A0ABY3FE89_9GAMM|nr:hypothetical protein [Pseudoalteromonas neustonica]TVU83790.1 hypothetical protein FQP85_08420 [Pseudoalteromonas neustonica]